MENSWACKMVASEAGSVLAFSICLFLLFPSICLSFLFFTVSVLWACPCHVLGKMLLNFQPYVSLYSFYILHSYWPKHIAWITVCQRVARLTYLLIMVSCYLGKATGAILWLKLRGIRELSLWISLRTSLVFSFPKIWALLKPNMLASQWHMY